MCSCKNKISNKQPARVKQVVKSVTPRTFSSEKPTESTTKAPETTRVVRNIQRRRVVTRRPI